MKLGPVFLGCVFLTLQLQAQGDATGHQPLKDYDFDGDGYSMVFIPAGIREESTVYYLDDKHSLSQLKRAWTFTKEAVTYPFACNDGYQVLLFSKGYLTAQFGIRNRCQAFISGDGWWHLEAFTPAMLREAKRGVLRDSLFQNLSEARKALAGMRLDQNLGLTAAPVWEQFDGYFYFRYPNPNKSGRAPFSSWEDITQKVKESLEAEHKDEVFELVLWSYGYGANYPHLTFRLNAKKSLYDTFRGYPKSESGWHDYDPQLTYFKKDTPD